MRFREPRQYYTYMMSNRSKTIYTGVTNGLRKLGVNEGFTHKYKLDRLVYYEVFGNVLNAIAREKEIKGWLRIRKIKLIVSVNPTWADLSRKLFPDLEEEVQKELAREKVEGKDVMMAFCAGISTVAVPAKCIGPSACGLQDDRGKHIWQNATVF